MGRRILVLIELCSGLDHITPAISNLGYAGTTTFTLSGTELYTQLASGSWDLVVVDEYANNLDSLTMDLLSAHVAAGKPLIFSYWYLASSFPSHALLTQAGVTVSSDYSTALPIYRWAPDPLFTTPNAVPDLTTVSDVCGLDGQYADVTTATAVAGYTTADTPNQTALTISADDLIILNLFMPQVVSQDADGDGKQDMVELYENELSFLF